MCRKAKIEAFLDELKQVDGVTDFLPTLWYGFADYLTVYGKEDIRVTFKNGIEIKT